MSHTSESSEALAIKGFTYGGYGVAVVGLGLSLVFLSQAHGAYADRQEIARRNGQSGTSADIVWDCSRTNECAKMASLREDQRTATERWGYATGLLIGGAAVGTFGLIVGLIAAPSKNSTTATARLVPAVSQKDASLRLEGTF
jgi:hypothetical protein